MDSKHKRVEKFYTSFLIFTESLFERFTLRKELDFESIVRMIRMACEVVRLDSNNIMYVMQTAELYKNPHVSHSVRSSIIAAIIGTYLKLPRHQLIELGVADLLCNISVLNLPGSIYTGREGAFNLLKFGTEAEKRLLYVHPIHTNKILKSFNFPLSICNAVLQHHELEDGTGFPQQLRGEAIDMYAKILVVAGYYEAFSTEQIDGARSGHNGVMQILKNGGSFNKSVVRALVNSISIYPVGVHVLLSNGKRGQVVDIDHEDPSFPIVDIFREKTRGETVKTSAELSIIRTLNSEEIRNF